MSAIDLIPEDKRDAVKANILKAYPVPTDEEDKPLHTEVEWLDMLVIRFLRKINKRGHNKVISASNPLVDF